MENDNRIKIRLKGLSPVQYRIQSLKIDRAESKSRRELSIGIQ
ncbi:IS3 family transposase [Clostridium sp. 19966]|nr:IS3 family transposase [Clostridium sp. 19966]